MLKRFIISCSILLTLILLTLIPNQVFASVAYGIVKPESAPFSICMQEYTHYLEDPYDGSLVANLLSWTVDLNRYNGQYVRVEGLEVGVECRIIDVLDILPIMCSSNEDCSGSALFCAKLLGECGGKGICQQRPEACPDVYDPVCGCNGKTYGNACEAAANGVSVAYIGECPRRKVWIPDMNVKTGETVAIPMMLDNATGIAGFQFTITFAPSVLNCTNFLGYGDLLPKDMFGELWNKVIKCDNDVGEIRIGAFTPLEDGILLGGSGSLLILPFNVVGNAGDSTTLNFTVCRLIDYAGNEIPTTCTPGTISITPYYLKCNLNRDDRCDIIDVILLLRCALGLDPIDSCPCADLNEDGVVDISDVILVLRCALGLDECDLCTFKSIL